MLIAFRLLSLQKLEQQLAAAQAAAEAAAQQAASATELADTRLKEKTAADKEWGRRLAATEKEAAAKLKEAEARRRELEDKSGSEVCFGAAAYGRRLAVCPCVGFLGEGGEQRKGKRM